jgi:methyl-accepting chemotaxis protein
MKNKIDKSIFKRSGSSSEGTQLAEENLSAGTTFSAVVLEKFETLLESIKAGHLDARADLSDTSGADREMLEGINEMLDAVIGPLNVAAEYVDRISKGDIPEPITDEYKGDFNEIKNKLNVCIDTLSGMLAEAGMVVDAAVEGKLDIRGDAGKFAGDFAKLVQGVNDTIDAVGGPLNVAAEYVDRSKNDRNRIS